MGFGDFTDESLTPQKKPAPKQKGKLKKTYDKVKDLFLAYKAGGVKGNVQKKLDELKRQTSKPDEKKESKEFPPDKYIPLKEYSKQQMDEAKVQMAETFNEIEQNKEVLTMLSVKFGGLGAAAKAGTLSASACADLAKMSLGTIGKHPVSAVFAGFAVLNSPDIDLPEKYKYVPRDPEERKKHFQELFKLPQVQTKLHEVSDLEMTSEIVDKTAEYISSPSAFFEEISENDFLDKIIDTALNTVSTNENELFHQKNALGFKALSRTLKKYNPAIFTEIGAEFDEVIRKIKVGTFSQNDLDTFITKAESAGVHIEKNGYKYTYVFRDSDATARQGNLCLAPDLDKDDRARYSSIFTISDSAFDTATSIARVPWDRIRLYGGDFLKRYSSEEELKTGILDKLKNGGYSLVMTGGDVYLDSITEKIWLGPKNIGKLLLSTIGLGDFSYQEALADYGYGIVPVLMVNYGASAAKGLLGGGQRKSFGKILWHSAIYPVKLPADLLLKASYFRGQDWRRLYKVPIAEVTNKAGFWVDAYGSSKSNFLKKTPFKVLKEAAEAASTSRMKLLNLREALSICHEHTFRHNAKFKEQIATVLGEYYGNYKDILDKEDFGLTRRSTNIEEFENRLKQDIKAEKAKIKRYRSQIFFEHASEYAKKGKFKKARTMLEAAGLVEARAVPDEELASYLKTQARTINYEGTQKVSPTKAVAEGVEDLAENQKIAKIHDLDSKLATQINKRVDDITRLGLDSSINSADLAKEVRRIEAASDQVMQAILAERVAITHSLDPKLVIEKGLKYDGKFAKRLGIKDVKAKYTTDLTLKAKSFKALRNHKGKLALGAAIATYFAFSSDAKAVSPEQYLKDLEKKKLEKELTPEQKEEKELEELESLGLLLNAQKIKFERVYAPFYDPEAVLAIDENSARNLAEQAYAQHLRMVSRVENILKKRGEPLLKQSKDFEDKYAYYELTPFCAIKPPHVISANKQEFLDGFFAQYDAIRERASQFFSEGAMATTETIAKEMIPIYSTAKEAGRFNLAAERGTSMSGAFGYFALGVLTDIPVLWWMKSATLAKLAKYSSKATTAVEYMNKLKKEGKWVHKIFASEKFAGKVMLAAGLKSLATAFRSGEPPEFSNKKEISPDMETISNAEYVDGLNMRAESYKEIYKEINYKFGLSNISKITEENGVAELSDKNLKVTISPDALYFNGKKAFELEDKQMSKYAACLLADQIIAIQKRISTENWDQDSGYPFEYNSEDGIIYTHTFPDTIVLDNNHASLFRQTGITEKQLAKILNQVSFAY